MKSVKWLCITAMGIALFVALSMCLRVPVFENYYVCLGYLVMTVYLYSVGTLSGTLVGFFGTIIYCLLISGLRGMPGWSAGNIVIGVVVGLSLAFTRRYSEKLKFATEIINAIIIVIAVAVGILGVKSVVECLLYSQPFLLRVTTNMSAFIADAATMIVSLPLCRLLDSRLKRLSSEEKQ